MRTPAEHGPLRAVLRIQRENASENTLETRSCSTVISHNRDHRPSSTPGRSMEINRGKQRTSRIYLGYTVWWNPLLSLYASRHHICYEPALSFPSINRSLVSTRGSGCLCSYADTTSVLREACVPQSSEEGAAARFT